MAKRKQLGDYCSVIGEGSCRVAALVSVDERGQMVLPKEIRQQAKINAGDKLALITWEKSGEIGCLFLIKAEEIGEIVKDFLSPMMTDLTKK